MTSKHAHLQSNQLRYIIEREIDIQRYCTARKQARFNARAVNTEHVVSNDKGFGKRDIFSQRLHSQNSSS